MAGGIGSDTGMGIGMRMIMGGCDEDAACDEDAVCEGFFGGGVNPRLSFRSQST